MQLELLKPVSVTSMREEARGKSRPSRNRKSRYNAHYTSKIKFLPEHCFIPL